MLRLITLLLLLFAPPALAETNYTFKEPFCPPLICGSGWIIYIDGEIRANEGEILEKEITTRRIGAYSSVYLNSPGGSLFGGMELGRVIRKYGFDTAVGKAPVSEGEYGVGGDCMSACTFAYLGGRFRYFDDKSLFGVHRFYTPQPSADAEQTAQVASAAIIGYLAEVGIDASFFVEMTKASSDTIKLLPKDQLVAMGVVNNGFGPTDWSIQASKVSDDKSMLYLRGARDTRYGINKVLFYCAESGQNMVLYAIFDPQGRAEVASMMRVLYLHLDDQQISISRQLKGGVRVANGWINAEFDLSADQWAAIKRAKDIGVMFQATEEAPVFLGFVGMPLEAGKDLMSGLEVCLH